MTTPTVHDFTNSRWGHRISILGWDPETRKGRAACWVTPRLKEGDVVVVKSEQGSMRLIATDVKRGVNVDDMYIFTVTEAQKEDDNGEWVVKARRNGGSSIIDVAPDKNKAIALAHELNEHHQTTRYYIERYDEKIHAYSRHG